MCRDFLTSLQRPPAAYAGYGQAAAPPNPALEALLAGRGQAPAGASPAHLGFPSTATLPVQVLPSLASMFTFVEAHSRPIIVARTMPAHRYQCGNSQVNYDTAVS